MTNINYADVKSKTVSRLLKKGKLRGRIDAKCCECIYDPIGGGSWRFQVENCTSLTCPLYTVRAMTIKGEVRSKEKAPASDQTERSLSNAV